MLDTAPALPSVLYLPGLQEGLREWRANRGAWMACEMDGRPALSLPHNPFSDSRFGVVAVSGQGGWGDYELSLDIMFTGSTDPENPGRGWVGVAVRVQDAGNYELFWFMPGAAEGGRGLAYVPVAHGLVPWWTRAYESGPGAPVLLEQGAWLPVRVRVAGGRAWVWAGAGERPAMEVALTYYLESGGVGVYCGTRTCAAFRGMRVSPPGGA